MIAVAVVFGLLVLLLALPVNVAFEFAGLEPLRGRISVRALLGLVRLRIEVPIAKEKSMDAVGRTSRSDGSGGANALGALRQAAFRRRVYRLVRDLFRAAHLHQVRLRMRLGLGDPADTGQLWAIVGPLSAATQNMPGVDIGIEPEFMDPVCEFEINGQLVLIPLQILALVLAFALSPTCIQAWRTA